MSANMPIRIAHVLVVLWFCGQSMLAQNAGTPRFEDSPVTALFRGTPVAPVLATPEMSRYSASHRMHINKSLSGPLHFFEDVGGRGGHALRWMNLTSSSLT